MKKLLILMSILLTAGYCYAGQLSIPNVFAPGEVISSSDMNENFSYVEQSVNNIEAEQIVDGAITDDKLSISAITADKIAADAVQRKHLYSDVVYSAGGINQRTDAQTESGSLEINVDDLTIEIDNNNLRIDATVADGGLTTGTGNVLKVAPDGSTLELSSTASDAKVRVKGSGIKSAQIAADAVGASELADNSVASANIINGTIVSADLSATANITPSQMNFASNSIFSYRTAAPVGIAWIHAGGISPWTPLDIDPYVPGTEPLGQNVLAFVRIGIVATGAQNGSLNMRPWGTTWTGTRFIPRLTVYSVAGVRDYGDDVIAIQATAHLGRHYIEYQCEGSAGLNCYIAPLGWVAREPQ